MSKRAKARPPKFDPIKSMLRSAKLGKMKMVQEMLDYGLPVDATDGMGRTALH